MPLSAATLPLHPAAVPLTLSPRRFRAAIAAVMTTILLGALDQTIVSVAVPTIARELGGFEWMAWVISGYLIASTVVTPLYGAWSDRAGRRLALSAAIALFVVASAACALAQTMPQLVLARVLQGIGGGGLIAMSQALVADVVPLRERGRYQSYVSIVWAVASMIGPVVGGVLTEALSWPWIFWINLPVGVAALVLVRTALAGGDTLAVPRDAGAAAALPPVDWLGAALLPAALSAGLIPVTRVGQGVAWNDTGNLAGVALAVLLLAAFVRRQRRHPAPIVPPALFANPVVVANCGLLFIGFFNFIALSVLVPLRLQLVGGLSAGTAGLHLLPMTLAIPLAAFLGGRWLYRVGRVRPLQWLGVGLVPVGLLGLGFAPPDAALSVLALVVVGLGTGLQMPSTLIGAQQAVPPPLVGTVTSLTSFFRLLGGAVGIAVLGSVMLALLRAHLPAGAPALGVEGLHALLAPGQAGGVDDAAFRWVFRLGAAVSLVSVALATRLPDLRLHDVGVPPMAPKAEP